MTTDNSQALNATATPLAALGARLRTARKAQKVSAVALAEAAGLSRVTMHRIERGEPGVAIGHWIAVATALGLRVDVWAPGQRAPDAVPASIVLDEYPALRQLADAEGATLNRLLGSVGRFRQRS
jgi:transcriptional regulator with XRE-family HTH domain